MRSCHILGAAVVYTLCILSGRLAAAIVNLPDVTVTSFGHVYTEPTLGNPLAGISDGVSFGNEVRGTYSSSPFVGQFQNGDIVRQHIVAPAGFQFFVFKHPSLPSQTVGAQLDWVTNLPSAVGDFTTVGVTYENVFGTTPTTVFGSAGVSGTGNMVTTEFHSPVISSFSFTGMMISFTVPNSPSAGTKTYSLTASSNPSFYSIGVGFMALDTTILGLSAAIPEPSGIFAMGMSCLGALRRRRR